MLARIRANGVCYYPAERSGKAKEPLSLTLSGVPDAERKELDQLFASLGAQWAEGLDMRGKPGTETLKTFGAAHTERQ